MSLQIWLPLNGTLENRGLYGNVTVSENSGSFVSGGKTGGQCYQCDNSDVLAIDFLNADTSIKEYSFAFWEKFDKTKVDALTTGYHWTVWLYNQNNVLLTGFPLNGNVTQKTKYFHSERTVDGSTYQSYLHYDTSYGATSAEDGGWHHYAFTYSWSDGHVNCYFDGALIATNTTRNNPDGEYIKRIRLAAAGVDPCFNDFRVYNHALSAKEIKELSKGLILHYKLDNPYVEGTTNYTTQYLPMIVSTPGWDQTLNGAQSHTPNGYWTSGWNSGVTNPSQGYHAHWVQDENDQWVMYFPNHNSEISVTGRWLGISCNKSLSNITAGTKYTVSFEAKTDTVGTVVRIGVAYRLTSDATSNVFNDGQYDFAINDVGVWKRYSHTFTRNASYDGNTNTNYLYFYGHYGAEGDIWVRNSQLEIKDHATPHVNAAANTATRTGDTVEVDCSGYGNDGTISGSLTTAANTPRYSASTYFDGSSYIDAGKQAMPLDEISLSWWQYIDSVSSKPRIISCTESGGIATVWNYSNTNDLQFWTGTGASSNVYKTLHSNTIFSELSSGWHHFVCTYDGLKSTIYIDGEDDNHGTWFSEKTPLFYASSAACKWIVGAEAGSTVSNYCTGYLSDIRIYSTALSADDVKAIYEIGQSIDNGGGIHAYEFVEGDYPNLISEVGNYTSNVTKVGTHSVSLDMSMNIDTYMRLDLNVPLDASKTYWLSFDVSGLADGDSVKFGVPQNRTYGDFVLHNGHNIGTITNCAEASNLIFDDYTRSSTQTITLNNFQLTEDAPMANFSKTGVIQGREFSDADNQAASIFKNGDISSFELFET